MGTGLLLLLVGAMGDPQNQGPPKSVFPLLVGQLIIGIGLAYGTNCGFPLNPARDLGPRVFTAVAGWGLEPFR